MHLLPSQTEAWGGQNALYTLSGTLFRRPMYQSRSAPIQAVVPGLSDDEDVGNDWTEQELATLKAIVPKIPPSKTRWRQIASLMGGARSQRQYCHKYRSIHGHLGDGSPSSASDAPLTSTASDVSKAHGKMEYAGLYAGQGEAIQALERKVEALERCNERKKRELEHKLRQSEAKTKLDAKRMEVLERKLEQSEAKLQQNQLDAEWMERLEADVSKADGKMEYEGQVLKRKVEVLDHSRKRELEHKLGQSEAKLMEVLELKLEQSEAKLQQNQLDTKQTDAQILLNTTVEEGDGEVIGAETQLGDSQATDQNDFDQHKMTKMLFVEVERLANNVHKLAEKTKPVKEAKEIKDLRLQIKELEADAKKLEAEKRQLASQVERESEDDESEDEEEDSSACLRIEDSVNLNKALDSSMLLKYVDADHTGACETVSMLFNGTTLPGAQGSSATHSILIVYVFCLDQQKIAHLKAMQRLSVR